MRYKFLLYLRIWFLFVQENIYICIAACNMYRKKVDTSITALINEVFR